MTVDRSVKSSDYKLVELSDSIWYCQIYEFVKYSSFGVITLLSYSIGGNNRWILISNKFEKELCNLITLHYFQYSTKMINLRLSF